MNTNPKTILIVDDEQDIREILCFNLEQAGYHCVEAGGGAQALAIIASQPVDLVLLDIMMPDMSGLEVAEQLHAQGNSPALIFITALGEETDVLRGFEIGADDYISKPFSLKQVLARVHAVLRRYGREELQRSHEDTVSYRSLVLYQALKTATLNGHPIALTRMEYELLYFLICHPLHVYSRGELLRRVWPEDGLVLDRTVDVTINRLRKKIGEYKEHIKAKTGYGYYWEQ